MDDIEDAEFFFLQHLLRSPALILKEQSVSLRAQANTVIKLISKKDVNLNDLKAVTLSNYLKLMNQDLNAG